MTRMLTISLAALSLLLALGAQASSVSGQGVVTGKDMSAGTVSIDGVAYQVSASTRVSGLGDGVTLLLPNLRLLRAPNSGAPGGLGAYIGAVYDARETSPGVFVLDSISFGAGPN